jgi:LCP family protein required for cell wall assembly
MDHGSHTATRSIDDRGGRLPAGASPPGRDIGAGGARRAASIREALVVTAVSALIPGLAHVRAGRTRTGAGMIIGCCLAVTGGTIALARHRATLLETAVRPGRLTLCAAAAAVLALAWAVLLIRSYALVRPAAPSAARATAGAAGVAVLCLLATAPPLAVARYAYVQRDLLNSMFAAGPALGTAPPAGDGRTSAAERPATLPPRLNLLLLGADADVGRPGLRTDSITVASIDTRTGETTLLSLPRNLQNVPVWSGRRELRYPGAALLNEVYLYGLAHPRALSGPPVRNPGAELLKRTVGRILGLPVSYYGMVDMRSFRQIVDAIGGVRVCIRSAVSVPRQQVPAGIIPAGCRKLSGREALWYGRSRTDSSDFTRMGRQKCLMWAIAQQASPLTILRNFQRLARVFKYSVSTDIPRDLLPGLIALSGKVKDARVSSIQFIPPLVSTGRPDYVKIRTLAHAAIVDSGRREAHKGNRYGLRTTCA